MERTSGLIDSTLREGGQAVGVHFTPTEQYAVVQELAAIGIEEIEVGIASRRYQKELAELVRDIRAVHGGTLRLAAWARCRAEDIEVAARGGVDVLSLSIPVSERLLLSKLSLPPQEVLALLAGAVKQAKGLIPYVSLGLEDATRAEPAFLDP